LLNFGLAFLKGSGCLAALGRSLLVKSGADIFYYGYRDVEGRN
jgi:hypothetical protein